MRYTIILKNRAKYSRTLLNNNYGIAPDVIVLKLAHVYHRAKQKSYVYIIRNQYFQCERRDINMNPKKFLKACVILIKLDRELRQFAKAHTKTTTVSVTLTVNYLTFLP